jgi:hypothetical protein
MEEAKIVFDLWKPLKQADKAKKLAGGKAKAAMEERKRRVANELSAICGSTIFVPESVPGIAEYSESVYRELINDARCRAESRCALWSQLGHSATPSY